MRDDPNRKIVYKIEDEIRKELGDQKLTKKQVIALFDDIVHDEKLHLLYPNKPFENVYLNLDGKVPFYLSYTDGYRVTLQKGVYTKMYLLHEFAHFLQHNASHHHGRQFCSIYCFLLYRFLSKQHGRLTYQKMVEAGCV